MAELLAGDDLELRRRILFRVCTTKAELHDWIVVFLGLDLPDAQVYPTTTSSPMDMVWEMYSKMLEGSDEDFLRVLYYASRDSFKTLGAAVIEILALLHCNRSAAHMAAIQEQAMKSQDYVKTAFRRRFLRDFVVGNNERVTKIVRYYNPTTQHSLTSAEYNSLSVTEQEGHVEVQKLLADYIEREIYVKIIICTLQGSNSEHVPLLVIDELDVVANPKAYYEAQNIPAGRGGRLPITMLTSTRKQAFGLVQKEIDRAEKTGLKIRHWNIIDVTQRCLPARHRPDLPRLPIYVSDEDLLHTTPAGYAALNFKEAERYVLTEGFAGCVKCKLFPACRTRLATHQTSTSLLLKSIPEVIGKFNANSVDMAKAQLLCLKPSSAGLIYGRFDKARHVLTPAQAYERVFGEPPEDAKNYTKALLVAAFKDRQLACYAGLDWGHTHNYAYVHSFKDGARLFVTGVIGLPGLDPDQMLEVTEPYKADEPKIYPDTADPKMIKLFKKNGFSMVNWKKTGVVGGINTVRWLLNPPGTTEPNLFIVLDIGEDPYTTDLVNALAEYHWGQDATGAPTNEPDKENDDGPDALRYLAMGVFPMTGKLVVPGEAVTAPDVPPPTVQGYDQANWVHQRIAELLGVDAKPAPVGPQTRRAMTIEAPKNSGLKSYYGDGESETANTPKKGKKGGLTWDI